MSGAEIGTPSYGPEDPAGSEARALLQAHLGFAAACTPEGHVHAINFEGLQDDRIQFCGARVNGTLMAVGAVRDLGKGHSEIKSMHTAEAARGQGLGRGMLRHLIELAAASGSTRISLETGTMDAFAPARRLYKSMGFVECEPFGDYWITPNSVCMTREL